MSETKLLNPEQKKAVKHGDGPLLIIAGAGTGKTTVITERIEHLIKTKNVNSENILSLTFTDKAAAEMEDRVDKIMPYGYTQMWISTFHSFCDQILREEAISIGLNPNFKLMTETEGIVLLKKNIFTLDLNYYRPLGNPNKFLDSLLTHFSRLSDEDITPDEYIKFATAKGKKISKDNPEEELEQKKIMELAKAFQKYNELKIKEGALDFSDLISQTLKLFRTRKNILKKYQDKFEYILVDEFQDTNYAQNELAVLLAGKKKNITVVADDDQAIYRWRGAALSNIMQFKNNFPGAKIITLTSNYRSTQEILDRSHQLIQKNNPNRLEVAENINKKLISERKLKGDPIEFINADRVEEEADEIAKKIKNLTKKYDFKDIAILIRANSHSQPITHALERHKIPYQFLGPSHLFNQDEIKDLISYFRVLYNLSDSISMYRILNMDIFGIPPRDINSLLNLARKRGISLFEMLEKSDETFISQDTKEKAKKLTSMILRHLELIKKDKPGQILYYFLVDSGLYKKYLDIKNERVQIEATNIAKFFDKIKTYETLNQDVSVYTIVDWIDLMMELGDNPIIGGMDFKNTNAVNILTVHSSKGLEFPVVFMVNLVSDRFPTRERAEKIPIPDQLVKEILPEGNYHTEEERRLFYVGMTRAKDQLIFTSAQFYADGKREKKISPFVYEALPELLDGKVHGKPTKQLSFLQATSEYKNNEKIPETKNIDGVNIQSISYSQLQTFDTCPLHYKAKYLLNLPSEITSSLSFGITIHNTFKEFYELAKTDPKITFKDFQTILSKNWISEGYQRKEYENLYRREGDKIIKNYFQNIFNPKHLPIALEKPFSFHIQKDKNDILRVGGKIDRIDKISENEIEIIDYKTGSLDKALKNNYETQLGIYALAALKMENGFLQKSFKKIKTTLLYLQEEKENRISQEFTLEDLKQIENKILNKVKEIETSDFKCNGGFLCQPKYCEYKMLCTSV